MAGGPFCKFLVLGGNDRDLLSSLLYRLNGLKLVSKALLLRRIKGPARIVELMIDDLDEALAERLGQALASVPDVRNVTFAADAGHGGSFAARWLPIAANQRKRTSPRGP